MNKNNEIRFSQNFITSKENIKEILSYTNFDKEDELIELGCGKGHFTKELVKRGKFVTAIEKDHQLSLIAQESMNNVANIQIVNKDILEYDFLIGSKPYKIFGNIPFNLSTKIVKIIAYKTKATVSYLIVEKGFSKRLLNNKRTLALLLLPTVNIEILKSIPNFYFHPKPNVTAVLIKIERIETKISRKDWKLYENFVRKWVNKEYYSLFTKNQFNKAMKHAKVTSLESLTAEQIISIFNSYKLFRN